MGLLNTWNWLVWIVIRYKDRMHTGVLKLSAKKRKGQPLMIFICFSFWAQTTSSAQQQTRLLCDYHGTRQNPRSETGSERQGDHQHNQVFTSPSSNKWPFLYWFLFLSPLSDNSYKGVIESLLLSAPHGTKPRFFFKKWFITSIFLHKTYRRSPAHQHTTAATGEGTFTKLRSKSLQMILFSHLQ